MSKSADRPRASPSEPVVAPRTISIVDDDKSFREAMARLMRSLGHAVAAFDSAERFLLSGRVEQTDCLICDVRMPRMGGIALQQALIAKQLHIPIIFVTAHPTKGAHEEAQAAGAIGFLNKPCNEQTLIALLEQALGGRKATE